MRVLVACECSGRVRDAFIARGHDAVSCDLRYSETLGPHIRGDVLPLLKQDWDLLIAFPPCTHLCCSGARWFEMKQEKQTKAIEFFLAFTRTSIPRVAIENPVGIMSRIYRKPTQIVEPFWFGDEVAKRTCLWLRGLPKLVPTDIVSPGEFDITKSGKILPSWYNMRQSDERATIRSRTFQGIADAMADQWGTLPIGEKAI